MCSIRFNEKITMMKLQYFCIVMSIWWFLKSVRIINLITVYRSYIYNGQWIANGIDVNINKVQQL